MYQLKNQTSVYENNDYSIMNTFTKYDKSLLNLRNNCCRQYHSPKY